MIRSRGGRSPSTPVVDIVVESRLWRDQRGVEPLLRRTIAEAAAMLSTSDAELAIVLTDDSAIRRLNQRWRGKDEPTNVLAFAAKVASDAPPRLIGDIVIAYETLVREAAGQHKPFKDHLAHLAVHGFLHLCGHDHAADDEARIMEGLEIAILARLGIPNPYVAQGHGG